MQIRCQSCGDSLTAEDRAFICSYECTYCVKCAGDLNGVCANCGGELSPRPRRKVVSEPTSSPAVRVSRTKRWPVIWLMSFAVWLFVTLTATLAVVQIYRTQGGQLGFGQAIYMQICQMMPFALLTPLVFYLVDRYPIRRDTWIGAMALYLVGGVLFSMVHVGLRGATHYGVWNSTTHRWQSAIWDGETRRLHIEWTVFKEMFTNQWYDDVIDTYVPILFVAYAISYYSKLREREKLTAQLEVQLTNANLQALKRQLQPHFLFNTMHSISALMFSDVRSADAMMSRLSELLRMSFEHGTEQMTSLSRELEFVNGYLDIEKMRLGERLVVDLDISPETLDARVPHFLLQPLVENAIQHGISKISAEGRLTISSKRDGENLRLTISDNGPGCDAPGGAASRPGLGIRASQERLETLYGEHQSFTLAVRANGGTEVTIRIPFRPITE